jgi:hypothetical protein
VAESASASTMLADGLNNRIILLWSRIRQPQLKALLFQ